jgi:hypothetical protein
MLPVTWSALLPLPGCKGDTVLAVYYADRLLISKVICGIVMATHAMNERRQNFFI